MNTEDLAKIFAAHKLWMNSQRTKGARANLSGANLSGADLSDAHLSGADLSDAHLSGANLRYANLNDAHLSGANLRDAHLSDADLSGADLSGANLSGADLSDAHLSGADLSDAHLSGANLRYANLNDADLSGADLSGANLSGADLSDANLENANLNDANLSRATLQDTCLDPRNKPSGVTLEDSFEMEAEVYAIGYRTRSTPLSEIGYEDGRWYSATPFSTSETECHPGLYLWPTLQQARDFSGNAPMIRVKSRPEFIHKAEDKFRTKEFYVIGNAP